MDEAYRVYIADSLRLIPQMQYLSSRWYDVLNPPPPIDADAIIDDLVSRLGGEE